jgi:GTP-binding protein
MNAVGKKKQSQMKKKKTPVELPTGSYWLPPPPFSSFAKSDGSPNKQTDGGQPLHDRKIIRRPVKCLGKAGSLKDKLPLASKGLSEVAICGRSNVGKSTVLNALLYGNSDESLSPRKFQRGRTPQGAMLPKGVKAITSHKPGETKELSFYQITADVMNETSTDTSNDHNTENNNQSKKKKETPAPVSKMSLLLVDLPGYGFAFAKEERTKEWKELMHHYLLERRSLKRILLLLDSRHGFKQTDFDFLGSLQDGLLEKNAEGKVCSF